MKKMSANSMRTVKGGGTVRCYTCGKVFKDRKFLWFVIETGEHARGAHAVACLYRWA